MGVDSFLLGVDYRSYDFQRPSLGSVIDHNACNCMNFVFGGLQELTFNFLFCIAAQSSLTTFVILSGL